jgi:hypothetical protein
MGGDGPTTLRPVRRALLLGLGAVGIGGLLPRGSASAIAQETVHAMLIEQDLHDRAGEAFAGTAAWHVAMAAERYDKSSDAVVRIEVEIPQRRLVMRSTLSRNLDRSLPASHTIHFMFILPPDSQGGGIREVANLLATESARARGTPLAGLTVKVTESYFLMGLSDRDEDVERNERMLEQQPWLALPIVYQDQRRATLAFAKGDGGTRALEAAFAAWEKSPLRPKHERLIERERFD